MWFKLNLPYYSNLSTVLKLLRFPKNWKKDAPGFELDSKNLQYFREISEIKPSKTISLNDKYRNNA